MALPRRKVVISDRAVRGSGLALMTEPLGPSPHRGRSPSGKHQILRRREAPPHIRRRSRIVVQLLTLRQNSTIPTVEQSLSRQPTETSVAKSASARTFRATKKFCGSETYEDVKTLAKEFSGLIHKDPLIRGEVQWVSKVAIKRGREAKDDSLESRPLSYSSAGTSLNSAQLTSLSHLKID